MFLRGGVDERIRLKFILNKCGVGASAGLIFLGIRVTEGVL